MNVKKILKLILISVLTISVLSGCNGVLSKKVSEPIQIAALSGPTGMGMAKLMEDEADQYAINLYQSPDEIVEKLVSGEVDIACIPSNLAAVLYNKTLKKISLIGTNTLGVLYIVENGESIKTLQDLKGKTLLLGGKGSAPEFILKSLLGLAEVDIDKDLTIKYMANHMDVVSGLVSVPGTIALLPEPHVSIAQSKESNIHISIDINKVWQISHEVDLPMGVIVARNDFIEEKEKDLKVFLKSYKKSVKFVNTSDEAPGLISKYKIIPSKEVAQTAIPKCNIVFRDAKESMASLNSFYKIISEMEPQSVGGSIPDEAFYYSK